MQIKKGSKVKVSIKGYWGIGTVLTAENNNFGQQFKESGKDENWYIEFTVTESGGIPKGYCYVKQLIDGATIELLEE